MNGERLKRIVGSVRRYYDNGVLTCAVQASRSLSTATSTDSNVVERDTLAWNKGIPLNDAESGGERGSDEPEARRPRSIGPGCCDKQPWPHGWQSNGVIFFLAAGEHVQSRDGANINALRGVSASFSVHRKLHVLEVVAETGSAHGA